MALYTNIEFSMPKHIIQEMKIKLNKKKNREVMEEAISLLKWAINEKENGKVIMSGNKDLNEEVPGNVTVTSPGLSYIANRIIEEDNIKEDNLMNNFVKNIKQNPELFNKLTKRLKDDEIIE